MKQQLSQDYSVDSRYATTRDAIDNKTGMDFLKDYLTARRDYLNPPQDTAPEDRFVVAGPGDSIYSFGNNFRASK